MANFNFDLLKYTIFKVFNSYAISNSHAIKVSI